jgi:hypothetical protein
MQKCDSAQVNVPVYLLHSTGDMLCEASASRHFQTLHSNSRSKFVYPEQGKHELLQETTLWKVTFFHIASHPPPPPLPISLSRLLPLPHCRPGSSHRSNRVDALARAAGVAAAAMAAMVATCQCDCECAAFSRKHHANVVFSRIFKSRHASHATRLSTAQKAPVKTAQTICYISCVRSLAAQSSSMRSRYSRRDIRHHTSQHVPGSLERGSSGR